MSAYDENHDAAPIRYLAALSDERRASVVTQLRALMYQHANNQRDHNISGLCAVAANELEALAGHLVTARKRIEDLESRLAAVVERHT